MARTKKDNTLLDVELVNSTVYGILCDKIKSFIRLFEKYGKENK